MKKIFSYILIPIILVQLFAPFSVGVNNKKFTLENNLAKAEEKTENYNLEGKVAKVKITSTNNSIAVNVVFDLTKTSRADVFSSKKMHAIILLYNESGDHRIKSYEPDVNITANEAIINQVITDTEKISPSTKYKIKIDVYEQEKFVTGTATSNMKDYFVEVYEITTNATADQAAQIVTDSGVLKENTPDKSVSNLPPCGIGSGERILGCVAQGTYYLLFKPTSKIFALSGKMLDFTFMYSISDTSYRSAFVTQGWGIVRDFCNMFFIFVLLYVAFKTIFDMNGAKTKETIIYVVIIGILINFSLFATKVIIDTSNVLAKVFYNQNTISITSGDSKENQLGEFGEIKLSEAIISKVDPQVIITRADDVNSIPIRTVNETVEETDENGITYTENSMDVGNFIIVVILCVIINIIGIMVFASCAFVFVVRVVGLWLAMIVVPFAFFSYTVPELQSIEMVGWKHWWPDTLKMAFMAPIFAFFMYIIVGFADKGLGVIESSIRGEKMGLGLVITILIPFIFLMVLLNEAKKITKTLSGTVGKMATEYASKIGKAAMGAGSLVAGGAMGLGAGVLRNTVGSLGNNIANNEKLKANEAKGGFKGFVAKNLRNIGSSAATGSMDVRGIKIGGKQLSQIGIGGKNLESLGFKPGKAKDTSFSKKKEEKIQKRTKRMKELEVGENSTQKQKLNSEKNNKKKLENLMFEDIEKIDREIKLAEEKRDNASKVDGAGSKSVIDADRELNNLKRRKKAMREGVNYDGDEFEREVEKTRMVEGKTLGPDGKPVMVEEKYKETVIEKKILTEEEMVKMGYNYGEKYKIEEKSLKELEDSIRSLDNSIRKENNNRREDYAENITNDVTQVVNFITTGHTQAKAEQEAANKIISNIEESKK